MSDIIVKFKPEGHQEIIKALKQLRAAQDKNNTTTKKSNELGGIFGVRNKRNASTLGIFGNTLSTVRSKLLLYNFAMASGVNQMIQFSKQAARLKDMSRAFTTLSGSAQNSNIAIGKISGAVKGTMSQMDLFKQANNAMILGVTRNTDEMAQMFQTAQTLGAALGVDTPRAVESLITGIGRQSRLMLDNIGIIVKADEAYKNYAAKLKTTADKLTDAEKKQAFFEAAMESARKKAAELGNQQLTARDQFNKFNATIEDFTTYIGNKSTPIVLDFFNDFGETLKRLTETNLETTLRQLQAVGASAETLAILQNALNVEQALLTLRDSKGEIDNTLLDIANRSKIYFGEEGMKSLFEGMGATISKELSAGFGGTEIEGQQKGFFTKLKTTFLNFVQTEKDQETFNIIVPTEFDEKLLTEQLQSFTTRANKLFEEGVDVTLPSIGEAMTPEQKELDRLLNMMQLYSELITVVKAYKAAQDSLSKSNENVNETEKKLAKQRKEKEEADKKAEEALKKQIELNKQLLNSAFETGKGYKNAGKAAEAAAKAVVVAKIQEAVISYMAEAMTKIPFPLSLGVPALGAAMAAALGSVLSGSSSNVSNSVGGGATVGKFEQGGYVGGRPHSQGGTIIEAERGEFVMSRNAVESIGLETLNQMNQSGGGASINVSVTGNVLTQDFVEGELAESIKEAVRRGSDFGIG